MTKTNYYFRVLAVLAAMMALSLLPAAKSAYAFPPFPVLSVFTVNSTGDATDADVTNDSPSVCDVDTSTSGEQCTLRAAIQEANYTAGADIIAFGIPDDPNVPGDEVKTIKVGSAGNGGLPAITDQVFINGYTQPGSSPNTLAKGTNAKLKIELDGEKAGSLVDGLEIGLPNKHASSTMVRGLVINDFDGTGISIGFGTTSVRVEGNFIGTDPSGTKDRGNTFHGVSLANVTSDNVVGGSTPDKRNLISGNGIFGIYVGNLGNKVMGNLIGTKKDGKSALGNGGPGVYVGALSADNRIGGSTPGSANAIAFNSGAGVRMFDSGTGNRVLRNSIFSNGDLGIDLGDLGPTPNDPGDADAGSNNLQNKPAIRSASNADGKTTVKAKLLSEPNGSYVVRFFSNPSGNEGKTFIGKKKVTTGSEGKVSFAFSPAQKVGTGKTITATATDSEGNTSEFSAPRTVATS